jgi:probable phosphoglycerate mutase
VPKLYLLRHAQSEANQLGVLAGRDNTVNLSMKGFKDSKQVCKELSKIEFKSIYSSPITRCLQTVKPLQDKYPKSVFSTHSGLTEMDFGRWSGKKLSDLSKTKDWKIIQKAPAEYRFAGGESFLLLRKRVSAFLKEIAILEGPILVVSHGDVIKMFLTCTLDLPTNDFQRFQVSPASVSIIDYDKISQVIVATNTKVGKSRLTNNLVGKFLLGGENA